jgi:hypothetical protein
VVGQKKIADQQLLTLEEAERLTGISNQQVSKWHLCLAN